MEREVPRIIVEDAFPIARIFRKDLLLWRKKRWGDLEMDTIIGKNNKGAILTINERKTGWLWTYKLPSKEAKYVAAATVQLLRPYKGEYIQLPPTRIRICRTTNILRKN